MQVRWIEPGAAVGAQRGKLVVCIFVQAGPARLAECLRSVLAHTAVEVPVLVCDDSEAKSQVEELVRGLDGLDADEGRAIWLSAVLGAASAAAAPADIVVLSSDCVVGEGWLERLRDAAYLDSIVATASALSADATLAPVARLRPGLSFDQAARAISASSARIRPRLETATGDCLYIRRTALELVGDLDITRPSARDEFSQRCVDRGLCHLLADDVLVLVPRPTLVGACPEVGPTEPLARSLGAARRALDGLSLAIDARILGGPMNGTKVHVLELIAAVARARQAHVTAIVSRDLSDSARAVLEELPDLALTTAAVDGDRAAAPRADVVHRPFQLSAPADLTFLAHVADRLVITHQDLIAYRNPSYFPSPGDWKAYRRLTRSGLAAADRVLFFSAHARADALAEELVEPHRASVVHIGVDHTISRAGREQPLPPPGTERLPADAETMLCLGSDYAHKNRIFALRILDVLQRRHGWRGWLLMAGSRAAFGSSTQDEHRMLATRPQLAEAVLDLGAVSEREKAWLMCRVSLMLYPTVHEGFGLVPFEAAESGVPCLWAPGTSLREILPDAAARIVPWDAAASADQALALIRDAHARASNLQAVREAAAALRWEVAAARLIEQYQIACNEPRASAGAGERAGGLMHGGLSEDAIRLVGPGGVLPRDLERPLLALATHPWLGAPVFRTIRTAYRASRRWRRAGLRRTDSGP